MPPLLTFVARVNDGLPLVSHQTLSHEVQANYQSQAKKILSGLGNSPGAAKLSIETSDRNIFHYLLRDGICYLTLTESSYPKRLAFLYLDEIADGFIQELSKDYGSDWSRRIETAARPYEFIKLDTFLKRKQRDFVDPTTRENTTKLNEDLQDIHSIMKKNIQEVLNRGEKLDKIRDDSRQMFEKSKEYHWGAKELTFQAMLNQYGPMVAMGVFVLFVLYLKFFW